MIIGHLKDTVLREVIANDNHLTRLVVIITEHGVPFACLLVVVGGIAVFAGWNADFHHAIEVMDALQVKVIGRHVVDATFQILGQSGIFNACDRQRLLIFNGTRTKLDTVIDHIDGCRFLIHLKGTLFLDRGLGFCAYNCHLFYLVDGIHLSIRVLRAHLSAIDGQEEPLVIGVYVVILPSHRLCVVNPEEVVGAVFLLHL